jgi:flavin-dependent dehydrogenase
MVDRSRFDEQLIRGAVAAGEGRVQLMERFPVADILENRTGVVIRGKNGQTVHAHYLIAGDGARGVTARRLGLDTSGPCGIAIDAKVDVPREVFLSHCHIATFNFHCVPNGYGWIFPKNGYLSCGLGAWRKPFPTEEDLFGFLDRSLGKKQILEVKAKSHPVPYYDGHHPISTPRICLVGDAARLVDPITGAGIQFALISGAIAAEEVLKLLRNQRVDSTGTPSLESYTQTIHQTLGSDLDLMYRYAQPVFLDAPELFDRRFVRAGWDYITAYRQLDALIKSRRDISV